MATQLCIARIYQIAFILIYSCAASKHIEEMILRKFKGSAGMRSPSQIVAQLASIYPSQ